MPHSPGLGAIYGIVSENGVPQADVKVYLFDRTGPKLLRTALSRADGGFEFAGLSTETTDYMVMTADETGDGIALGVDEDGGAILPEGVTDPYKNALIQDRVKPVPIHMGTEYPAAWFSYISSLQPGIVFPAPYASNRFTELALLSSGGNSQVAKPYMNAWDATHIPSPGSWDLTGETPFVDGANTLPVVTLNGSWVRLEAQSGHSFVNPQTRFSVVIVPDFAQSWAVTQSMMYTAYADDYNDLKAASGYTALCSLEFNTDRITIKICNANITDVSPVRNANIFKAASTYVQVLETVPTSWEFVALSYLGANKIVLRVGDLEFTLNETTVPTKVLTFSYTERFAVYPPVLWNATFHDVGDILTPTGPSFAFYAAFPRYLGTDELDTLKDLLWNGGTPTETGYTREITKDYPVLYWKMDAVAESDGAFLEHYVGDPADLPDGVYSTIATNALKLSAGGIDERDWRNSPLFGHSAPIFNGRYVGFSEGLGSYANYRDFSFSFWLLVDPQVALNTETMLMEEVTRTEQVVIKITKYPRSNVRSDNLQINLTTERKLRVVYQDIDVTFDHVFDEFVTPEYDDETGEITTESYYDDEGELLPHPYWTHVTVVISKTTEYIYLYINGEETGQGGVVILPLGTNPTAAAYTTSVSYGDHLSSNYQREIGSVVVGGQLDGTTLSATFCGSVTDLAFFNYPLPDFRIAEHYESYTII